MIFHVNTSNLRRLQVSLLTKETYYVPFGYFIFFPLADIKCSHARLWADSCIWNRNFIVAHFGMNIFRNLLVWSKYKVCLSRVVPSRGSSHTVNIAVFTFGKMIMDDVLDVWDIQSPAPQVCAHHDIRRAIEKFIERTLSVFLVQTTMIGTQGKSLLHEKICGAFY